MDNIIDRTYSQMNAGVCQICGTSGVTRKVTFSQNIGLLIQRRSLTVSGFLCKKCINREFTQKTLMSLFFGWWGVISFYVNVFYLLRNFFNFVPTIGMKQSK